MSDDIDGTFPDWFVEKWAPCVHFQDDNKLPIASKQELKVYGGWSGLPEDLARCRDRFAGDFRVIWLHECGGVTRMHVRRNGLLWVEPASRTWEEAADGGTHYHCYECAAV